MRDPSNADSLSRSLISLITLPHDSCCSGIRVVLKDSGNTHARCTGRKYTVTDDLERLTAVVCRALFSREKNCTCYTEPVFKSPIRNQHH